MLPTPKVSPFLICKSKFKSFFKNSFCLSGTNFTVLSFLNKDKKLRFMFLLGFLFTKSTVKRFRKISKYYLLEVLKLQPDIRMLKNAIRLVGISEKKLYSYKELDLKKEKLEYYS